MQKKETDASSPADYLLSQYRQDARTHNPKKRLAPSSSEPGAEKNIKYDTVVEGVVLR